MDRPFGGSSDTSDLFILASAVDSNAPRAVGPVTVAKSPQPEVSRSTLSLDAPTQER